MSDRQVEGIEISQAGGIQTIRFARPDKKNAILSSMYAAMTEALQAGDASPDIRVNVFVGSGGVFSAGNDINDFLAQSQQGSGGDVTPVQTFVRQLPRVQTPMIAAVDGLAVGVGATMLFHCDLVYATPSARIMTPFLDLGLVPEAGSSLLAPMRMGYARAFELLVLGNAFDAERAVEAGLVNGIVPSDDLEAMARDAAERLVEKPSEALMIARRLMRPDPDEIVARVEKESALFSERMQSPEAQAAFRSFVEKRSS